MNKIKLPLAYKEYAELEANQWCEELGSPIYSDGSNHKRKPASDFSDRSDEWKKAFNLICMEAYKHSLTPGEDLSPDTDKIANPLKNISEESLQIFEFLKPGGSLEQAGLDKRQIKSFAICVEKLSEFMVRHTYGPFYEASLRAREIMRTAKGDDYNEARRVLVAEKMIEVYMFSKVMKFIEYLSDPQNSEKINKEIFEARDAILEKINKKNIKGPTLTNFLSSPKARAMFAKYFYSS